NALTYAGPPVEIQAAERDGCAEIWVTDHGPGVPASFIPHLFERFARAPETEHKTEGTGLGLWIVRAFAHANSGDAWYEPGRTGGASFCLHLPLAQAPRMPQPADGQTGLQRADRQPVRHGRLT
ncbi:MAG TPA: ATP-binding protein, partial [Streptosporangiaceae bacterium]